MKHRSRQSLGTLGLCRCVEHGTVFETGLPVTFPFIHNTEKSPQMGALFGQDVEPVGRYLLHVPPRPETPQGWVRGEVSFRKPLVLWLSLDGAVYGPTGWKARLAQHFGKHGRALTTRLRTLGFDGVVTCASGTETSEIVDMGQRHH